MTTLRKLTINDMEGPRLRKANPRKLGSLCTLLRTQRTVVQRIVLRPFSRPSRLQLEISFFHAKLVFTFSCFIGVLIVG